METFILIWSLYSATASAEFADRISCAYARHQIREELINKKLQSPQGDIDPRIGFAVCIPKRMEQ